MPYILLFIFLTLQVNAFAVEQADLSSQMIVDPRSTNTIKVEEALFDWKGRMIRITVGDDAVSKSFFYYGVTATNMMNLLNKANLTSNSLQKRILNQLISDGYLSGTISGSPE